MRRNKPTSCRNRSLSEVEEARLLFWYRYERTFEYMAQKLGVSVRTLYRYVKRQHKPRKPSVDRVVEQLLSLESDVPQQGMT